MTTNIPNHYEWKKLPIWLRWILIIAFINFISFWFIWHRKKNVERKALKAGIKYFPYASFDFVTTLSPAKLSTVFHRLVDPFTVRRNVQYDAHFFGILRLPSDGLEVLKPLAQAIPCQTTHGHHEPSSGNNGIQPTLS